MFFFFCEMEFNKVQRLKSVFTRDPFTVLDTAADCAEKNPKPNQKLVELIKCSTYLILPSFSTLSSIVHVQVSQSKLDMQGGLLMLLAANINSAIIFHRLKLELSRKNGSDHKPIYWKEPVDVCR